MVSFFSRCHPLFFFSKLSLITIFSIYLVILAGIFVRVTGSGMGCPDWPKCYGLIIPPTSINQLTWLPHQDYSKGQMIIKEVENETILLKARTAFKSSNTWTYNNWIEIKNNEKNYFKHNYADFSSFKTWVEYLNRCLGAISGILIFMLALTSLFFRKIPSYLFGVSGILIFLSLVQYLLGRNVVYSVLESQKISLHFFVALIFIPLLLFLFYKSSDLLNRNIPNQSERKKVHISKKPSNYFSKINTYLERYFFYILYFSLFLSLIQMFFGTQVRGHVEQDISTALKSLELIFHRFLVPIIIILNIFLFFGLNSFREKGCNYKFYIEKNSIVIIILSLLFSGSYMYVFEIPSELKPKWSTLIHAYSSVLLFSVYVSLVLKKFIYK